MEAVRCTHINYVTYVNALHTENAGLQGKLLSLWCCCKCSTHKLCKSHLILDTLPPSSVQDGCPFKMEKPKTKVTVAFGRQRQLLLLHESPPDVQTVVHLLHYGNDRHLGTCNRKKWTLNWKYITVKKKVFYCFLCCFISTFSEGMCNWVLTRKLTAVLIVDHWERDWVLSSTVDQRELWTMLGNAQNCTGGCLHF